MQKVQLYIDGTRVDLFKDETISLTQTIQDVKDIEKVFTDFSKTFSIPASKANNKLFKHYYNCDIEGGFDARKKVDAYIELNSIRFKTGKVTLQSVGMKNNVANSYKITFFGNTITLKEILGEDKLSVLTGLNDLNETYTSTNILTKLQVSPTTTDLVVPLITHTDRLVYDTSGGSAKNDGAENLASSGNQEGLHFDQLKCAIRLHRIIEAIEEHYVEDNLVFSDDFFNTLNEPYYKLFMWLHRKKGEVKPATSTTTIKTVNTFTSSGNNDSSTQMIDNTTLGVYQAAFNYTQFDLEVISTSTSPQTYRIIIQKNGVNAYTSEYVSGNITINKDKFLTGIGNYTVLVEGNDPINFTSFKWVIEYDVNEPVQEYLSSSYIFTTVFDFEISQQIPDMKIIDLLTGLFKMFNLTAYIEDGVVVVKTLDSFYSSGTSYDISKYIDVETSSVGRALPYKEVDFKYEDTETILAKQHQQLSTNDWGATNSAIEDDDSVDLSGGIYKIEIPFSHLKYERLIDIDTGNLTFFQYGYFVDDNQDSYIGKPLLFYPVRRQAGTPINFINDNGSSTSTSTYIIPSNSVDIQTGLSKANINFKNELNEYTNSSDFDDTLFNVYYKNYIKSVFNTKNRITKFTAYLPLKILLNYNLSDRFVINSRSYKINSITTDLTTGKSSLELLNDL